MAEILGDQIRVSRSQSGAGWEWSASRNLGHMAWTATGVESTRDEAMKKAEAFLLEILSEGWE